MFSKYTGKYLRKKTFGEASLRKYLEKINSLITKQNSKKFKAMFFSKGFPIFYEIAIKIPVGIQLYKVNNRNTRRRCEICSKLTVDTGKYS